MAASPPSKPLVDGGPSDQASVRPDPQDAGMQGSQSGRPQAAEEAAERRARGEDAADRRTQESAGGRAPQGAGSSAPQGAGSSAAPGAPHRAEDAARGVSDTERRAGSPDSHVRTDNSVGDGTR